MSTVATLPAHHDGWTIDDLYDIPEDGLRYELLDGMLLVSPPAAFGHYSAAFELGVLLKAALGDEWRIACNPGVSMGSRNYREPDLVVVHPRAVAQKLADAEAGDVLLVVEAMSPRSVTDDRLVKPAQYARARIPHYWRLEQRGAPVLITHALDGETYRETGRFTDQVAIDEPARLRFRLGRCSTDRARQYGAVVGCPAVAGDGLVPGASCSGPAARRACSSPTTTGSAADSSSTRAYRPSGVSAKAPEAPVTCTWPVSSPGTKKKGFSQSR